MNLLGRTWRIIKANTRDWQQQRVDPERELNRALARMQQDLAIVQKAIAEAVANQKSTERRARAARDQATIAENNAKLALLKGNRDAARAYLSQRQRALSEAESMEDTIVRGREVVRQLKADLQVLERDARTATLENSLLRARARSATTAQNMSALLGTRRDRDGLLSRAADRVAELEAAAELARGQEDALEAEFRNLERGDRLDAELARLEGEIHPR